MTAFTKEIEDKIRKLGQSLKLQLDFAAAADMGDHDDRLEFLQMNTKSAGLVLDLVRELKIKMADDATLLEAIADVAEQNGSDAGDSLKAIAKKVRAIKADVLKAVKLAGNKFQPAHLNAIFRKHLKP